MKKNSLLVFFLFSAAFMTAGTAVSAQNQNDFGTWVNLQATKSWDRSYAFLRTEHRSMSNVTATEAFFVAAGGGYRITKWLNADLSYEFWDLPAADKSIASTLVHKVVLSATGTLRREALAVSLREKYELSIVNANGKIANTLRSRLRGQYSIGDGTFTPYVMYEFFTCFEVQPWVRSLHYVGCEIRLAKCLTFDIFYNYHLYNAIAEIQENGSRHLLGAGLNFNF